MTSLVALSSKPLQPQLHTLYDRGWLDWCLELILGPAVAPLVQEGGGDDERTHCLGRGMCPRVYPPLDVHALSYAHAVDTHEGTSPGCTRRSALATYAYDIF